MSIATTPYATDEDIALRASADYPLLRPRDQRVAVGSDGAFLPGDRWTLISPGVDFQARGAAPGQVVILAKSGSSLRPDGEGFVVTSSGPGSITVRRPGLPADIGEPPAPPGGLAGVDFEIATFGPQVDAASSEIDRRFGIAPGTADPRELRDAVVLTVLSRQYFAMSREMGRGPDAPADTFAAKGLRLKAELDDLLARLTVHRGRPSADAAGSPPMTRFSTRMSR